MPAKEQPKKKQGIKTGPKPKDAKGLSLEQSIFVEKYIQSNNVWQSAIDAGYSDPSYGYQLLRKAPIKKEVMRRRNEMMAVHRKESQSVLNAAFALLQLNSADFAQWDAKGKVTFTPSKQLTRAQTYGVNKIKQGRYGLELGLDTLARAKALDFLGRYFGLWIDKDAIEDMLSRLPEEIREPLRTAISKHQQKGEDNGGTSQS